MSPKRSSTFLSRFKARFRGFYLNGFIKIVLLLKGNLSLEKSKRKKPYNWLPDQSWEDCIRLAADFPKIFASLVDELERDEKQWKSVRYQG